MRSFVSILFEHIAPAGSAGLTANVIRKCNIIIGKDFDKPIDKKTKIVYNRSGCSVSNDCAGEHAAKIGESVYEIFALYSHVQRK